MTYHFNEVSTVAIDPVVETLVDQALAAQREIETWSEQRIDMLLHALADVVAGHAHPLAVATVAETGMGNVRDKTLKNSLASVGVYRQLAGQIGLGEIGGRVAKVADALGMEVVAWSPRMTPERAAEKGALAVSLEELLTSSMVVSLHLVPTDQTRRLLNAQRLACMREDAIVVNTSRSVLIDTPSLLAALRAGRPAMAALDVYDEEPLAADHPLRSLPNVVLTPHIGFVSQPVFEAFARGVTECLQTWLRDEQIVRALKNA